VVVAVVLALLAGAGVAVNAASPDPSSPSTRRLAYVESSTGLVPPSLEGGGTEVEMGDVDGDGRIDLVSIGITGRPTSTPISAGHGWFGDGAGRGAS
jgi:hypothetical protein